MPECDCGTEIQSKNSAGHWRKQCSECIQAIADESTPHILQCDSNNCEVCEDRLEEYQSVFRPIYLRCLLERPQTTENETLDQYQ